MDVINISGLQFRVRPNVTVAQVLEVFRGFGKEGTIQRNGIVEYLDAPIEFNTSYPYQFVDSVELITSGVKNYRNGAEIIPDLNRAQIIPSTILGEPLKMTEQPVKLLKPTEGLNQLPIDVDDKRTECINRFAEILKRQRELLALEPQLLKSTELRSIPIEILKDQERAMFNEVLEKLKQREELIKINKTLCTNDMLLQRQLLDKMTKEPKYSQYVVIKAYDDNYLNLDEIEVYNLKGENIANRAGILSSAMIMGRDGIMRTDSMYRQLRNQNEQLRSSLPGGWIRMRFDDDRNDSISRVVLRNAQNCSTVAQLLTDARLEIRKVDEYSMDRDSREFTYVNAYSNELINAIEIKALEDRPLQLSRIVIRDLQDELIRTLLSFDSSDLAATRSDLRAEELLFDSKESNEDFIQSVNYGGFIRLTLPKPMQIRYLSLYGLLRGVKVTFERTHSFLCSGDLTQTFYLNENVC